MAKKKADAFAEESDSNNNTLTYDRLQHIKNVLIDSYDEILISRDSFYDLYKKAIGGWLRSLDREKEWAKLTGFFSDDSKLSRLHDNSVKEYKG